MSSDALLTLTLVFALGAWFWHHLGVRQRALQYCRQVTQKEGVQLLDESIIMIRMRPTRSQDTLFAFERTYQFEFSTRGDRRFLGWVVLNGVRLARVELQPYSDDSLLQ
ncbi:MAG: DUF3301 domain-containing protein [Saccharospirillum sp.]